MGESGQGLAVRCPNCGEIYCQLPLKAAVRTEIEPPSHRKMYTASCAWAFVLLVVNSDMTILMNGSAAPLTPSAEAIPFEYRTFTKPQMAAYFQVEIRTLESWVQRGILHPRKMGRTVRFLGSDILAMLDACRRGPRGRDGQDYQ